MKNDFDIIIDESFYSSLNTAFITKSKKKKNKVIEQIQSKVSLDGILDESFYKCLTPNVKKNKSTVNEILVETTDPQIKEENIPKFEEEVIEESLLNPPANTKTSDPLTPLDQKFATLDDLQNHYKLFLNRIQQQLSTLGGGGETRLRYLDEVVGIATNSGAYNNKFLQWNSTTNQAEFVDPNDVGGITIVNISGITTYYQASNTDDYIGVNSNVPVTIVLPISPNTGKKLIVKDEGNKIATYNITVQAGAGTSVENDTSVIMSINHQSFTYFYNGSNWFLI
jgi:hypothetical protein